MTKPKNTIIGLVLLAGAVSVYLFYVRGVSDSAQSPPAVSESEINEHKSASEVLTASQGKKVHIAPRVVRPRPGLQDHSWRSAIAELASIPKDEWKEVTGNGGSSIELPSGTVLTLPRASKRMLPDVLTIREQLIEHPDKQQKLQNALAEGEGRFQINKCGAELVGRQKIRKSVKWSAALDVRASLGWAHVAHAEVPNWPSVFDDEAKSCYVDALRSAKWKTGKSYQLRVEFPLCIIVPSKEESPPKEESPHH